ncbi:17.8 kDa class I heat shock protein-like [Dorcoceras hygrometricum]|uniref:17.8 kDa class I heat shock protein-like n=1 Tax=Dorcoceras hygrometricum TaxID=472368 RepID=A0A2Z7BWK3_9LAMI|nr:17.8 kDa class I heat shock protein-like [Dorcoceras hygrometricum]
MEEKLGDQAPEIHEFEPFCKWHRKEDRDILEIHLQDFKREQLKVQISHQGTLKISGERSINPSQKSKFYKELAIANTYDSSTISAKFVNGWLHITMPKRKPTVPEKGDKRVAGSKDDERAKQDEAPSNDIGDANAKIEDEFRRRKQSSSAMKMAKTAVTVAVTGVAVAALVAYVIYMYKSMVVEDNECNY